MQEEKLKNVRYCKIKGVKRIMKNTIIRVRSHRNYTTKDKRKRILKPQGSCKMPFSCTSQVVLTRNVVSDKCYVSYYKTLRVWRRNSAFTFIQIGTTSHCFKTYFGCPAKEVGTNLV